MSRGKWKNKEKKTETVESKVEAVAVAEPQKQPKTETETEPDAGIVCSRCRFPMRVCRTKPLFGAVQRIRVCDRCGHKKATTED